jgi:hypothetical protein
MPRNHAVHIPVCSQNPIRSKITECSGNSRRRLKSSRESLRWVTRVRQANRCWDRWPRQVRNAF